LPPRPAPARHTFPRHDPNTTKPARLAPGGLFRRAIVTLLDCTFSQWDKVVLFDESYAFREHRARWLYTALTRAADAINEARPARARRAFSSSDCNAARLHVLPCRPRMACAPCTRRRARSGTRWCCSTNPMPSASTGRAGSTRRLVAAGDHRAQDPDVLGLAAHGRVVLRHHVEAHEVCTRRRARSGTRWCCSTNPMPSASTGRAGSTRR
jgi:hypothetical protein